MELEQYEEDVKVVLLPERQEVTSEDLATMPDVVRERVRYFGSMIVHNDISYSHKIPISHAYHVFTKC